MDLMLKWIKHNEDIVMLEKLWLDVFICRYGNEYVHTIRMYSV